MSKYAFSINCFLQNQFWRSYRKKLIFFIFHFLKILPPCLCLHSKTASDQNWQEKFFDLKEKSAKSCKVVCCSSDCGRSDQNLAESRLRVVVTRRPTLTGLTYKTPGGLASEKAWECICFEKQTINCSTFFMEPLCALYFLGFKYRKFMSVVNFHTLELELV